MQNNKIRYYRGTIDMAAFEPVISPAERRKVMAVNVSAAGHLAMNQRFSEALKTLKVDLRASKDRRMILVSDSGEGDYQFPKSGNIKDVEFVRSIAAAGLTVPCRYIMMYSEEMGLWVGEYSDTVAGGRQNLEAAADQLMAQKKGKTGRKRNAG